MVAFFLIEKAHIDSRLVNVLRQLPLAKYLCVKLPVNLMVYFFLTKNMSFKKKPLSIIY